jgi:hypothetical protein
LGFESAVGTLILLLRAAGEKDHGKSDHDQCHSQAPFIRNFRFGTLGSSRPVPGTLPLNRLARRSNGAFAAAIVNDIRYRIAISEYDILR